MTFHNLTERQAQEIIPGFRAKFIHSDHITLAYWDVDAGAVLPEHSHPQEQIANVLEGQFELTVAGKTRLLTAGMGVVIPAHTPHAGRAVTDCRLLDAFYPVREDYQ